MPKLNLTTKEAAALAAKRKRDKAWNAPVMAAVEVIKRRLKKADPLEAAVIQAVLQDLRRMIR